MEEGNVWDRFNKGLLSLIAKKGPTRLSSLQTCLVFYINANPSTFSCPKLYYHIITFKNKPISKNLLLFLQPLGRGPNTLPWEKGTQKTGLALITVQIEMNPFSTSAGLCRKCCTDLSICYYIDLWILIITYIDRVR